MMKKTAMNYSEATAQAIDVNLIIDASLLAFINIAVSLIILALVTAGALMGDKKQ